MSSVSSPDLSVLVVADDPAAERRIRELLAPREPTPGGAGEDVSPAVAVRRCATVAEAEERLGGVDAILLWRDHREGVDRLAGDAPVLVVTDGPDPGLGAEAVAAGAQDHLVDDELLPRTLARSLEFAVERWHRERRLRRRADDLRRVGSVTGYDVREEASLVAGRARQLAEHVDHRGQARIREIVRACGRLFQLTRAVDDPADGPGDSGEAELVGVDLDRVVEAEVSRARERYDGASIEVAGDLPAVRVHGDGLLGPAVGGLLTNAVVRGDPAAPVVAVSVDVEEDRAVLRVADDGDVVPDRRKDTAFTTAASAARVDCGADLLLAERVAQRYGAGAWIADDEPEGAVFAVAFRTVA